MSIDAVIPEQIIGKYEILKYLGKGAFANVYLAAPLGTPSSPKAMQEKGNNMSSTSTFPLSSAYSSFFKFKKASLSSPQPVALKLCKKVDLEACESLKNGSKTLLALKEFSQSLCGTPSLTSHGPASIPFETALALTHYQDRVVKAIDYFETDVYICLCLELIQGKELFECIIQQVGRNAGQNIFFEERSSLIKNIMKSVLEGVSFIHAAGFAHGDIKLENIMILDSSLLSAKSNSIPEIKIIDFGLSSVCQDDNFTIEGVPRGSEHYFAPEAVLMMPRNPRKLDIWACGVVMFAMLTLRMPFDLDTITARLNPGSRRSLVRKIAMGSVQWSDEEKDAVSKNSYDLVMQMLRRDPLERPTTADLLKHPYFSD